MRIAVTGHRPNKLWGYNLSNPMYQILAKTLYVYCIKNNATKIITGMALGVDTVFAFVGLKLKQTIPDLKLECAIPCKNHSSKWQKESVDMYNRILEQADEVTLVTNKDYTTRCMQQRNEYMVNNCDILIAVWDGEPNGGTWNCIKYARSKDKQIIYINPKELKGGA